MYKEIEDYFQSKAVAIIGASRNKAAFSSLLLKSFKEKGFKVYAVNPNAENIDGVQCYHSIAQLPADVEAIYIIKNKNAAIELAREAAIKGIRKIWIHIKCDSAEIKKIKNEFGVSIIAGECFFMWAEPVKGFHRFHRFLHTLFQSTKEK